MHIILFCVLSFLTLKVSANCSNNKCLKALNSDIAVASSFCSVYTTNTAIATPASISSGCKASPSKILSACSCIDNTTTTIISSSTSLVTSKRSSTRQSPTVPTSVITRPAASRSTSSTTTPKTTSKSLTTAKVSSSSHTTSIFTSLAISSSASRSTSSTSCPSILPSTITVTIVKTTSIHASLPPTTVTQIQTQTATTTTTLNPSPCSLFESGIPSCVFSSIFRDFGYFQPGCFGAGTGPSFVANCICPYLSQLPGSLQNSGCASADITTGLMYQQAECHCLGVTTG